MDMTGVILAGGKSTRFGEDKAGAKLAGAPMLQWVVEALEGVCNGLVLVRSAGQVLPEIRSGASIRVVTDEYEALGPLAGLASGFAAVGSGWCFAAACDAPLLRGELVSLLGERIAGMDVVCPVFEGRMQPLTALYNAERCLPLFRASIRRGTLKLTAVFAGLRVATVGEEELRGVDPDLESFRNANRPEEAAAIEAVLKARGL